MSLKLKYLLYRNTMVEDYFFLKYKGRHLSSNEFSKL